MVDQPGFCRDQRSRGRWNRQEDLARRPMEAVPGSGASGGLFAISGNVDDGLCNAGTSRAESGLVVALFRSRKAPLLAGSICWGGRSRSAPAFLPRFVRYSISG